MDQITHDPATGRVELVKANGNTFLIASYDDTRTNHRRGAFVLGGVSSFKCSQRTKSLILKHFYPHDSLRYLEEYGYIAS